MKSNCLSFDDFISYMNSQLSKEKQLAIESHLCDCDKCLKKLVESFQLIQDPTLDTHIEPMPFPDFSKITQWILEQIKGLYNWRPLSDFYDLAIPVPQVEQLRLEKLHRDELHRDKFRRDEPEENKLKDKPLNSLIKAVHEHFPTRIWIEKKENSVSIWVHVRSLNPMKVGLFITLNDYSQTFSDEPVLFENIPFGKYILQIETEDCDENIVELIIDEQQLQTRNILNS